MDMTVNVRIMDLPEVKAAIAEKEKDFRRVIELFLYACREGGDVFPREWEEFCKIAEKNGYEVSEEMYLELKPQEIKYPVRGYAPGGYICRCKDCGTEFSGDKRAWQCKPCAFDEAGLELTDDGNED